MIASENAPEVEPFAVLDRSGVPLPAPEGLGDEALTPKLWEVIDALADLGVCLEFTDHRSDRELYGHLWNGVLREPIALFPEDMAGTWHIDVSARGSQEDHEVDLKYYADEESRRHWTQDWPDYPMPDRQPLPFDRDRHLP